jgi:hypothetical protein
MISDKQKQNIGVVDSLPVKESMKRPYMPSVEACNKRVFSQ